MKRTSGNKKDRIPAKQRKQSPMENQLKDIDEAYNQKNYAKALDLYNLLRDKDQNHFDQNYSYKYGTCLYHCFIKTSQEITNDYCNCITYIVQNLPQNHLIHPLARLHYADLCKKIGNYPQIIPALDTLDPTQLSAETTKYRTPAGKNITLQSLKQRYYNLLSLAYEKTNQPDLAMKISNDALKNLPTYTNNMDIWFQRRVAKSYIEQKEYIQAINILNSLFTKKKEWFILHELAKCNLNIGEIDLAKQQLLQMIDLAQEPKMLVTALLDFTVFEKKYPELTQDCLTLALKIRQKEKWKISDEMNDYLDEQNIKLEDLPHYQTLFKNLKHKCSKIQRQSEIRQTGTISKILATGSGFIRGTDHKDYYFTRQQLIHKTNITTGSKITFSTQQGFDHKKQKETTTAIHIETIATGEQDA